MVVPARKALIRGTGSWPSTRCSSFDYRHPIETDERRVAPGVLTDRPLEFLSASVDTLTEGSLREQGEPPLDLVSHDRAMPTVTLPDDLAGGDRATSRCRVGSRRARPHRGSFRASHRLVHGVRGTPRASFETKMLGVVVTVTRIELRDGGLILAVCTRAWERQVIPLVDLPLPRRNPRAPTGSKRTDAGWPNGDRGSATEPTSPHTISIQLDRVGRQAQAKDFMPLIHAEIAHRDDRDGRA
jgi:hypothetical protein